MFSVMSCHGTHVFYVDIPVVVDVKVRVVSRAWTADAEKPGYG
jgi:hypothetical protein